MERRVSHPSKGLLAVIGILLLGSFSQGRGGPAGAASLPPRARRRVPVQLEQRTFERVNQERLKRGIPALRLNLRLIEAARWHSRDMAERHFFSHLNPDGYSVVERSLLAGLRRARRVSENLGLFRGPGDPVAATVEGWLRSPGHRRSMLNPEFRVTGIGVAVDAFGIVYFTQVFADRV